MVDRAAEITRERVLVVGIIADFTFASVSDGVLRNWVRSNDVRIETIVTDVTPLVRGPSVDLFRQRDNALVVDLQTMRILGLFAGTTGGGTSAATGVFQALDDIIARQAAVRDM